MSQNFSMETSQDHLRNETSRENTYSDEFFK